MPEYESSLRMPATSEIAFQVASEVETMERWLPTTLQVEPAGPDQVHVEGEAGGGHYSAEGLFRSRPEQLRLEWGSRDDDDYSGWLQVADSGAGASEVTIHLSFRGEAAAHHGSDDDMARGLDEALHRLSDEVRSRVDDAG